MTDENYFDSEKAFKEAVEPGRRSFLKKLAVVAGMAAVPTKPTKIPDPPRAVPMDHPPVKEQHYDMGVVYTTCSVPVAMTTVPFNYTVWEDPDIKKL